MYQDLFLYRCSKQTSFNDLEVILGRVADFAKIQIRDLSKEAPLEKANMFSSIITALHRKDVDENEAPDIYVIKCGENEFYIILSMSEEAFEEGGKHIFTKVFSSSNYEDLRPLGGSPHSKDDCLKYWKLLFEDEEVKPTALSNASWVESDLSEDLLAIDPELSILLKSPSNANVNLSSLCTTMWGLLACKYFEADSVLIEDIHENGRLTHMPVKVDSKSRVIDAYAFVEMQYKNALDYDDVSLEEIEVITNTIFTDYMVLSQNFIDKNSYGDLLKSLHTGIPYRLPHFEKSRAPLCITYHFSDTIMRLQYEYDVGLFKKTSLRSLHTSFCELLKQFLIAKDNVNISQLKFQASKEASKQREIAEISQSLLRSGVFKSYSGDELLKLASQCSKKNLFYEDLVLDYKSNADALYVLSMGKIVVEAINTERFLRPVMVYRPGDLFAIESLIENTSVDFYYRVVTEMAELVRIPADVLRKEVSQHSEIGLAILEIQTKRLHKFERQISLQ